VLTLYQPSYRIGEPNCFWRIVGSRKLDPMADPPPGVMMHKAVLFGAILGLPSISLVAFAQAPTPSISPELILTPNPTVMPSVGFGPNVVATDGTDYLVVWPERGGLRYRRVGADGSLLDPIPRTLSAGSGRSAVIFDGARYAVLWSSYASGSGTSDLYLSILDRAGTKVGADRLLARDARAADIAFDGTGYVALWMGNTTLTQNSDGYGVFGMHLDAAGAPLGAPFTLAPAGSFFDAQLAFGDGELVVLLISASLSVSRISSDGAITSMATEIWSATPERRVGRASIAFGGHRFLVAWDDTTGVVYGPPPTGYLEGMWIVPAQDLGTTTTFQITGDDVGGDLLATFWGGQFTVGYTAFNLGSAQYVTLAPDATTASAPAAPSPTSGPVGVREIVVGVTAAERANPRVAFGNDRYIVVSEGGTVMAPIMATPVSATGKLLNGNGVPLLPPAAPASWGDQNPHIAFGKDEFLVTWTSAGFIVAARLDGVGTPVGSAFRVFPGGSGQETGSSVAFDGTRFLVVINDLGSTIVAPIDSTGVGPLSVLPGPHAYQVTLACRANTCLAGGSYGYLISDGVVGDQRRAPFYVDVAGGSNGYTLYGTLAAGTNGYLFALPGDMGFEMLDPFGEIKVGPALISTPPSQGSIDRTTTFDGTNYFLAWDQVPPGPPAQRTVLMGTWITPTGEQIGGTSTLISDSPGSQEATGAAAGPDGQLLVVYVRYDPDPPFESSRQIRARLVNRLPDMAPPRIAASGDRVVEAESVAGAEVTFATPMAADDRDGSVIATCAPASGTTFPLGTTTVDCRAADLAGNVGRSRFTITVGDTKAPTLSLEGAQGSTSDPTGTTVFYQATATDLIDGPIAASCQPPAGSRFPVGSSAVVCSAVDMSGNQTDQTFYVMVTYVPGPDPGVPDGGSPDAGSPADGHDAETGPDAADGGAPAATSSSDGCGCRAAGQAPLGAGCLWAIGVALISAIRPSRRKRARTGG
jgi:hypothetical protein